MNRTAHSSFVCLGVLAIAAFGSIGCSKPTPSGASAAGETETSDMCSYLTDAEVAAASKLPVAKHHGDKVGCTWQLGAGAQSGLTSLMKSNELAEKAVPRMGPPKTVTGIGDSAEWLGGATPILVIHAKGGIYRLSMTSPPLMTLGSADPTTVDFPDLKAAAATLGKAFVARLSATGS